MTRQHKPGDYVMVKHYTRHVTAVLDSKVEDARRDVWNGRKLLDGVWTDPVIIGAAKIIGTAEVPPTPAPPLRVPITIMQDGPVVVHGDGLLIIPAKKVRGGTPVEVRLLVSGDARESLVRIRDEIDRILSKETAT